MRVADYVAQFISEELGVKHIFGVTGAGIMCLTDGIACNEKLQWVGMHDERSCAMAADAYSRASENIGVCMVSTGPAATNALTGVAGAWQDSVPMLVISGQVKTGDLPKGRERQGGIQHLSVLPMARPVTKYCTTVFSPSDIRVILKQAIYAAKNGRPGPVWIEIPMDVQSAEIDLAEIYDTEEPPIIKPLNDYRFAMLKNFLKEAHRPVIVAGQGVRMADAAHELAEFARKSCIPVVTTYLGIDVLPFDHPAHIGVVGVKGTQGANLAMQNADLIIAIGTSLHSSVTGYDWSEFAPEAAIVMINLDMAMRPEVLERAVLIESDAKDALQSINKEPTIQWPDWLIQCQNWKHANPVCLPEYGNQNIYYVIEDINNVAGPDDIIISDAGSAFYCASQGLKVKGKQRYITSGAMATMGFSVPAAIGAHLATGRKVWAITGDGSVQQCLAELALVGTLDITVVILVNDGYLSIRNSQKNYFDGRMIGNQPPMLPMVVPQNVVLVRCDPNQEVLPSVQSWLAEDGTMRSSSLDKMKTQPTQKQVPQEPELALSGSPSIH